MISALFESMINVALREETAKFERLEKHYEKPTFEVVSRVFRALSRKKITSAGSFQRQVLVASFKDHPRLIDYALQPNRASRSEGNELSCVSSRNSPCGAVTGPVKKADPHLSGIKGTAPSIVPAKKMSLFPTRAFFPSQLDPLGAANVA